MKREWTEDDDATYIAEVRNYGKGFVVMRTRSLMWMYSKDTSFVPGDEVVLKWTWINGRLWVERKEQKSGINSVSNKQQ